MPLDGITLHFLTEELRNTAVGCRVDKIHQPSRDELVFLLRSRGFAGRLLLSANANSPRVHFTATAPENPSVPPMLCMLLRKHLSGALLTDVRQTGLDRVLLLSFSATDELGNPTAFTLCAELMAKHSNLILCRADGFILDAVKRIDDTRAGVRPVQPGLLYTAPSAQNKINLLQKEVSAVCTALDRLREKPLTSALLFCLEGASPLLCRELAQGCGDVCVGNLNARERDALRERLSYLRERLLSGEHTPTFITDTQGSPSDFSCMTITQYAQERICLACESYSELLDDFYRERDRADRTRQRSGDLMRLLTNAQARLVKKLAAQRAELETSNDREPLRIYAELILANQYRLEKGMPFYELENYYADNALLRIPANPALSPPANAQKYFKNYRKAKTAQEVLSSLIVQGEQELLYLESVEDALQRADGFGEITAIREELAVAGYGKKRTRSKSYTNGKQTKPGKEKPLPPISYRSQEGFTILVGRNNIQNDQLSLKQAKKQDLWLHTQGYAGSHVIVVSEGQEIPESTVREAAQIAAWHSKARQSAQVPVDYTPVKQLQKPAGAKPGKVIYHSYNTVWVKPMEGTGKS